MMFSFFKLERFVMCHDGLLIYNSCDDLLIGARWIGRAAVGGRRNAHAGGEVYPRLCRAGIVETWSLCAGTLDLLPFHLRSTRSADPSSRPLLWLPNLNCMREHSERPDQNSFSYPDMLWCFYSNGPQTASDLGVHVHIPCETQDANIVVFLFSFFFFFFLKKRKTIWTFITALHDTVNKGLISYCNMFVDSVPLAWDYSFVVHCTYFFILIFF